MAFSFNMSAPVLLFCAILVGGSIAQGQLSTTFYDSSCPSLKSIVSSEMANAIAREARMGASILRLFFHDCFVNGCDASLLLDDTATFTGEKNTPPNKDSARGFEVIDAIKSRVEAACPATVSCADILALAALEGTSQLGGPTWTVPLGRRDATTASQDAVNSDIPTPADNLDQLISLFVRKGFSAQDMTALSGAHTIGLARCVNFRQHIYTDSDIDAGFAALRQQNCPSNGGDDNLAPLDLQSSDRFDNLFYQNLMLKKGLLHSDQELFSGGSQDSVVTTYSNNANAFKSDFAAAMVKMGNMSPLTGLNGEIRLNCRRVN